jgi:hypothetical protein
VLDGKSPCKTFACLTTAAAMKRGSIVVFGAFLLEIILVVIVVVIEGFTLEALQSMARYSGRVSLIVFSVIFLFRYRPADIDVRLLGKPYHVFAVVHGCHLLFLMFYFLWSGTEPGTMRWLGGIAGGLLSVLMPLVARSHDLKRLTVRTLKNIELVFQYFIWLIFFIGFYARVNGTFPRLGGTYAESVILLGWVSLMLGMKVTSLLQFNPFTSKR